MRRTIPYAKLSLAGLLFVVSLAVVVWNYRISAPKDDWSKVFTAYSDYKTTNQKIQMMVYVDRPIARPDQPWKTYLRIRNAGRLPLERTSTYTTDHRYVNGQLYGEAIGDWEIPGAPLKLLPGETKDVEYRWATRGRTIGFYGFQFSGFGGRTNTVTVYVLPGRPFWIALAAIAALAMWRAWLGMAPPTPLFATMNLRW